MKILPVKRHQVFSPYYRGKTPKQTRFGYAEDSQLKVYGNLKSRVETHVENAVVKHATDEPAHSHVRVSLRKKGILVSPSGVRSIWLLHDLANFKQRLKALEPSKH